MASIDGPQIPATLWSLTGAAIILTAGRYAIRAKIIHHFFLDDLAHFIALLALLGFAIGTQWWIAIVPQELSEMVTTPPPDPVGLANLAKLGLQLQIALSVCAWVSLWAVKFAFLLLYRLIFSVSTRFVIVWWIVVVFTFVAFWAPIAGILTACGSPQDLYNEQVCTQHAGYHKILLIYSSAAQVVTDLIVMILPLWMLARLQMRWYYKLGLALLFSVVSLTIALEILRTVESIRILQDSETARSPRYAATLLYAALEIPCSVIVSCLPVYKALFGVRKVPGASDEDHSGGSQGSRPPLRQMTQRHNSNDFDDEETVGEQSQQEDWPLPKSLPATTSRGKEKGAGSEANRSSWTAYVDKLIGGGHSADSSGGGLVRRFDPVATQQPAKPVDPSTSDIALSDAEAGRPKEGRFLKV